MNKHNAFVLYQKNAEGSWQPSRPITPEGDEVYMATEVDEIFDKLVRAYAEGTVQSSDGSGYVDIILSLMESGR